MQGEVSISYIRYSLFLSLRSRALTREWIAVFVVQSTYTRMLDSFTRVLDGFTRVFVTHTREYEILVSLLAGISNTLRVYLRVFRVHYSTKSKYLYRLEKPKALLDYQIINSTPVISPQTLKNSIIGSK